ncbi:MAG: hypothetical protein ACUVS2_00345 [Candidatus Flexifilum sp.]|jgi:hypothetical protein
MPDEPLVPPQDDNDREPSDADAFSSYVNDHLDLSDLGDDEGSTDTERAERPSDSRRRTPALSDDHDPWEVDDEIADNDDDDDDVPRPSIGFGLFRRTLSSTHHDEDDEPAESGDRKPGLNPPAPPGQPSSGTGRLLFPPPPAPGGRSSYEPPLRTGSVPAGFPLGGPFSRPSSEQALPPRIPIPSAGDSRWVLYRFRTQAHLEIHHPASLTTPARSTVIPNAAKLLHGHLHAIPAAAPGWVAVKVALTMRQPIIGFVRADQIHLLPAKPTPDWPTQLYNLAISKRGSRLIQSALLLLISLLLLIMLVVLVFEPQPQPMPDLIAVEAQLEAQAERIEALERRLEALGAR